MIEKYTPEEAEAVRKTIDVEVAEKLMGTSQAAQLFLTGGDLGSVNEDSKPTRPYAQVDLVFTCVNKLINSVSGLPLVLSDVNERIVESGPGYDLLFNNPNMNFEAFVTQTVGHYALSGDVFWIFTDFDGSKPKEILIVSGTQMHPVTHNRRADGELIGWEFRGLGGKRAKFSLDEVHQWKNFNPYDRFHGLGPATAAKLNIDYSFAAALYNATALANGAEPGAILTTEGKLDDDQIRQLRSQFDSRHRGASKTKRTALLTGGVDIKTIALKMSDMQVAKISEMSDKKICSAFGVPSGIVNLSTEAQYSHGPDQKNYIFNTIMSLARLLAAQITSGILARFYSSDSKVVHYKQAKFYHGMDLRKNKYFHIAQRSAIITKRNIFAWFDFSDHPTVQDHQREVSEKVLKFTEAGVPLNDIIETHDLPYELTEAGKYRWISMGLVPADYILEAGPEGITGPAGPEEPEDEEDEKTFGESIIEKYGLGKEYKEDEIQKADEQKRSRIWDLWVASWLPIEREYQSVMRVFFVRQQRILIDKLKKAYPQGKAITKVNVDDIVMRVVFDLKKEDGKIRMINQTFFEKASELGIRQTITEITGLKGDALTEITEQVKRLPAIKGKMKISTVKISKVNKTTREIVTRQLREGLEAGENLNQLTQRIKQTLGSSRGRAQRIARTQTAGAIDTGRHSGMKAAGTDRHGWVDSKDNVVRATHKAAAVTYKDGIPIDQPFQVGSSLLMFPADPSGPAKEIINCRCIEIAIAAQGKSFGLDYYANIKFYSYEDMTAEKQKEK